MIENKTISVIIPCKNEGKIIASVIKRMPSCVDEIIVVDNNSSDNTVSVAKQEGAIVLREKRAFNGIGYGFALQNGLQYARGNYLVALDGDDTYPASETPKIVKFMERNNLDFVSCNRLPLKHKNAISKIRQLGIRILNLEALLLYGYPIKDILTGMWVVKKEAFKKLDLKEGGWNLSPEVKLAAISHPEIKFAQYHIPHFCRNGNLSKQKIWETGWGHLIYILKRRFTTDNLLYQLITSFFKGLSLTLAKSS